MKKLKSDTNVILSHDMMEEKRVNAIRTTDNEELGHFLIGDNQPWEMVTAVTSIKGAALPLSPVRVEQAVEWLLAEKRKHDTPQQEIENANQQLLF